MYLTETCPAKAGRAKARICSDPNYGELTGPIVKAIQQQQQEITAENTTNTALKQQISVLTSEIADLKKDIADLPDGYAGPGGYGVSRSERGRRPERQSPVL